MHLRDLQDSGFNLFLSALLIKHLQHIQFVLQDVPIFVFFSLSLNRKFFNAQLTGPILSVKTLLPVAENC